jgi:hypothetical protein
VCYVLATATFLDAQTARPAGWLETHGSQAAPAYSRLFAMDKVHELNITIAPESFRHMKADLETIMPMRGAPPFGAFAPPDGKANHHSGCGGRSTRGSRLTPRR